MSAKIIKLIVTTLAIMTVAIYLSAVPQVQKIISPEDKITEQEKPVTPSAQIADSEFQITQSGFILKGQNTTLPKLYLPGDIKVQEGQLVEDKNIVFAANLAALTSKTDFHPASIRLLAKNEVALYETDQTVAIFSSEKSPDVQVDSLQQVLAAAKIEGTKLAKIDLRYNKPTITFK
ncbi:MAG: hypothetical protein Q8P25_01450 [Candidatus Curtissbacteria bacterium]|nr:hypothetical protein [Candidatus Curtissbacteria bacterium]